MTAALVLSVQPALAQSPGGGDPGGGGGGGGQIAIGYGWVVVGVTKKVIDTVTTTLVVDGVQITQTRTRDSNDGFNGRWIVNGSPSSLEHNIPEYSNIYVAWESKGRYAFTLEYRGHGVAPKNVPIECWQTATGHYVTDGGNWTHGAVELDNGIGGGAAPVDPISTCTSAYSVNSAELKFINSSGTQAVYETPEMTAKAEGWGYSAAAFAEVSAELRPSSKNIYIASTSSPIMDVKTMGTRQYSLSFADSTDVRVVPGSNFVAVPFEPDGDGVKNYRIFYRIGRPYEKKLIDVLMHAQGHKYDHDPHVPSQYTVMHSSAAFPMGAANQADSFAYLTGLTYWCPPTYPVPISPSQGLLGDYLEVHRLVDGVSVLGYQMSAHIQQAEMTMQQLEYKWGDGVTGKANAFTEHVPKLELCEFLRPGENHTGDIFSVSHDTRDLKVLTGVNAPNTSKLETISTPGDIAKLGSFAVSIAAAGGNPYLAALAALAGVVASAIEDQTRETRLFSAGMQGVTYVVQPVNWQSACGVPPSSQVEDHLGRFFWGAKLREASNVRIQLAKIFDLNGFDRTELVYYYQRTPLQGDIVIYLWLVPPPGGIF